MTLSQLTARLKTAGIADAAFEAGLLIEHFCRTARARMLADPDRDYDCPALETAAVKRCSRYPLQYILGTWEFMGLPFTVNENCLIPRPDTESIAEAAIAACPEGGRVLDLCTGSGCILAAVLHYTKNTAGTGAELFPETAALARKNLDDLHLGRRAEIVTADVTEEPVWINGRYDVITANPPYIAAQEMPGLEPELSHEPRAALTDESDGLRLYEAILRIYPKYLAPGGTMILEHGWQQSDAVKGIAESFGLRCEQIRDYGGNVRGAVVREK